MTTAEAIYLLEQLDPDEELLITWWTKDDCPPGVDWDTAALIGEQQLENCIGHVNDWMESNA